MEIGGNKTLFIEGTSDDTNGDLRQGFHKLLAKKLLGSMPRIVMGDNTPQTIKKFVNCKNHGFALIDLDSPESEKQTRVELHSLEGNDCVFFMIQEMESWFLSQPDILNDFYGCNITKRIPQKSAKEIHKPAEFLMEITRHSKKGKYHKVKHGVELLKKLNASELEEYFSDFASLIRNLKNS